MTIQQINRAKRLRDKGFSVPEIATVLSVPRREVHWLIHGRIPPAKKRGEDRTSELIAELIRNVPPGRDPEHHRRIVAANFGELV